MSHNTPETRQQLARAGRHAEAFQAFQEALVDDPHDPNLLYNAGLSAYLSGRFAEAAIYWTRLKDLAPHDLGVRAKLVQAYEALQDREARDAERAGLFALRARQLGDRPPPANYCRDQFQVGGIHVQAHENLEFGGEMAVRYIFYIFSGGQARPAYTLSLGSYAATDRYAHERGQLQPDERLFHLDENRPDGQHRTWRFFKNEPPYEVVKAAVLEILRQAGAPGGGPDE